VYEELWNKQRQQHERDVHEWVSLLVANQQDITKNIIDACTSCMSDMRREERVVIENDEGEVSKPLTTRVLEFRNFGPELGDNSRDDAIGSSALM